jgi:cephalosporin-C deacetylase-like acetyl esterase
MIFGGFENAGEVLNLIRKDVPYVLATFDYPFRGLRQFQFPKTIYEAPELKHAMQDTFLGVPALFRYLKSRPDVDTHRIGIIGASFGSPFALMTAAQEPDLSSVVLIHAFGDTRQVIQNRLNQIFISKNFYFSKQTAWLVSWMMQLYFQFPDVEKAAQSLNSNQHVLFIEALNDEFIPKSVRKKLWEELNLSAADVDRIQLASGHLQPGAFEMIDQIMNIIQGWVDRIDNSSKQ